MTETSDTTVSKEHFLDVKTDPKADQHKKGISSWNRGDLEDRYLRLYEDHIYLKKHCHKQEDRLKRLGTKVMQLVVDRKKSALEGKGKVSVSGGSVSQETVNDMETKMYAYEKQNKQLKEKLRITKQHLLIASKQTTAYNHVQPRINTGLPKPPPEPRILKNRRVIGPQLSKTKMKISSPEDSPSEVDLQTLSKLQEENEYLQRTIEMQQQQVEDLQRESRMKEIQFQEDISMLKLQINSDQRVNVEENTELIRIQRECKEKCSQMQQLQVKYQQLEEDLSTMRLTYQSVLGEMDRLTAQLKEEQSKQLSLQQQLKMATSKSASIRELQEQIISLQNDKQLLVESNDKLTRSAFDLEREREWRQRESALKVQIAQLEAAINADLGERSNVIDRLNKEIAENSEAERLLREVRIENYQLQEQNEELKKKMSIFTSKSDVDLTELEEALTLVRSKQDSVNKTPSFVMQVDTEVEKVSHQNVHQLESDYAAMVHELEKTRNMLLLQYKINKDYHKEIEAAHQKTEHTQRECEIRLNEYATLLDIRAARIKKMESQLRDIAYGTKQQKLALSLELDKSNEMDENIQLERGQNIFEIHVHKVNLTTEAVSALQNTEPALFCTWEFYEFELQSTPVIRGTAPVFDFTSQYVITIDDFFLHYIQKSSCTLELQQSLGQSYQTLAACQLTFRDLFEHPPGRIHSTAFLIGIEPTNMELKFGSVEYWINLRLPMEQAVRLYKERIKALGYISSNDRSAKQALKALDSLADQRPDGNINELHVKILRCTNLTSRRKDVQPSPYCVYQFFDFPDHDTVILHSTNNPEFNDHRTFPVVMNAALDNYLRSVALQIYVFDDCDPEETGYLCSTNIPLLSLAHDGAIKGFFELHEPTPAPAAASTSITTPSVPAPPTVNGQIEIAVHWQNAYLAPPPTLSMPHISAISSTEAGSDQVQIHNLQTPASSATMVIDDDDDDGVVRRQSIVSLQEPVKLREGSSSNSSMAAKAAHASSSSIGNMPPSSPLTSSSSISAPLSSSISAPSSRSQFARQDPSAVVAPSPLPSSSHEGVSFTTSTPAMAASTAAVQSPDVLPQKLQRSSQPKPALRRTIPKQLKFEEDYSTITLANTTNTDVPSNAVVGMKNNQKLLNEWKNNSSVQSNEAFEHQYQDNIGNSEYVGSSGSGRGSDVGASKERKRKKKKKKESKEEQSSSENVREGGGGKEFAEQVEEEVEEMIQASYEEAPSSYSDNEDLVIPTAVNSSKNSTGRDKDGDTVTVVVSYLTLDENSPPLLNDRVTQLYIEYRFLNYPPEELETPYPLPKPRADQPIHFNFSKCLHVDYQNNYEKRQFLASMLLPDDPDGGSIRFTVVSEPEKDAQTEECEEIGVAYVSLVDILKNKKDIVDEEIPIYDIENQRHQVPIGRLNVSVICLKALQAVDREIVRH
ncbi:protein fantom-like isoform X2 [Octopus sinensis]|uniref:Protein fantom-like isoform X2 n=1 Tax=Octopus sinensis TaxID=2607531 RepID=A0A7E6FSX2_9MOLL|nr:protein fantom-like isoform X2 [Octopus sinensis]